MLVTYFLGSATTVADTWGHYLKVVIVDAGAWNGLKVASSKEAESRAVPAAIKEAIENGFARVHVLLDAKEVVQAIKGNFDWSINPKLALNFAHMEYSYIPRLLNSMHCYSSNRGLDREMVLLFLVVEGLLLVLFCDVLLSCLALTHLLLLFFACRLNEKLLYKNK